MADRPTPAIEAYRERVRALADVPGAAVCDICGGPIYARPGAIMPWAHELESDWLSRGAHNVRPRTP